MIEIYGLDINELDDKWTKMDIEADIKKKFSAYRMDKIRRCKNENAKKQSIAAGYLLDYVLSQHGLSEKSAVFHTNSYGKRLLADADVNLSHSGHYVLCAYGSTSVGIDIEQIKEGTEKIARRFFAEQEYQWMMEQERKEEAFCRLWTLKESYVKQLGTGMATPFNQFEIKMQPEISVRTEAGEVKADCYLKEYRREDYCIAVCAEKREFPKEITFIQMCGEMNQKINEK